MTLQAVSGPGASVVKYDLLTALSLAGLRKGGTFQQSVLRLMVLITARYNWRHDELSMGQADIARLWSVDIRTVKREMKRLTQHEFLFLKRPARRGRVAAYGLNRAAILALSEDDWKDVGPDYVSRMTATWEEGLAPLLDLGCGVGVDHVAVVLGQLVVHVLGGMRQEVACVNRAALDRHSPQSAVSAAPSPGAPSTMTKSGRFRPRVSRSSRNWRHAAMLSPPIFRMDSRTVAAHADGSRHRDVRGLAVQSRCHRGVSHCPPLVRGQWRARTISSSARPRAHQASVDLELPGRG
jgi:hypothetical protein